MRAGHALADFGVIQSLAGADLGLAHSALRNQQSAIHSPLDQTPLRAVATQRRLEVRPRAGFLHVIIDPGGKGPPPTGKAAEAAAVF